MAILKAPGLGNLQNNLNNAVAAPKPAATPTAATPTTSPTQSGGGGGGTTTNAQTGQVFQNATTGPYTYQNATRNGYVAPEKKALPVNKDIPGQKIGGVPSLKKSNTTPVFSRGNTTMKGTTASSDIEGRLADAISKFGANDPRVTAIQKLLDNKNTRASNPKAKVTTPTAADLANKISDKGAKKGIDEMELDARTDNLYRDKVDTVVDKTSELVDTDTETNAATEANTKDFKDEFTAEYNEYKDKLNQREAQLEADEASNRAALSQWKTDSQGALANEQAGQQAEISGKLGKLGASEGVMSNAQNEIRNNAGYQKQKADLDLGYINNLQSAIKDYQGMYTNITQNKVGMTDSKVELANKLLDKINSNKEKINTIKQAGIKDSYSSLEALQDARLEDSTNSEMSAKQNSEDQYRWDGMDSSARIAKVKDALYKYDEGISRASLTVADYEKAAAEGDITKAVAMLANIAQNAGRAPTAASGGGSKGGSGGYSKNTEKFAQSFVDGMGERGITTIEGAQAALAKTNYSSELKALILKKVSSDNGWKAPMKAGITQFDIDKSIADYKKTLTTK